MITKQIKQIIIDSINSTFQAENYEQIVVFSENIPTKEEELQALIKDNYGQNGSVLVSFMNKEYGDKRKNQLWTSSDLMILVSSPFFEQNKDQPHYKYDIENLHDKVSEIMEKTKQVNLISSRLLPIQVGDSYRAYIRIEYKEPMRCF